MKFSRAKPQPEITPAPETGLGAHASVHDLLGRMKCGDRDALAEFITRFGTRIRQRVRRQLAPSARRLFDSMEVLSTVSRRLDHVVRERRITASSEGELWALVQRVVERSVIDKGRIFRRLQRVEGEDAPLAAQLAARLQSDHAEPTVDLAELFAHIPDPTDREILALWLRGLQPTVIARVMQMPAGTVRRRWHTLRARLREQLEGASS